MPVTSALRGRGRGGARSGPHTQLVEACLAFLKAYRIPAWKNNTGCFMGASGHLVRASFPGCADIIGMVPNAGRFLAVECKTGSGVLTADQVAFQCVVDDAGGVFIEARSIDDLRVLLAMRAGYSVTG